MRPLRVVTATLIAVLVGSLTPIPAGASSAVRCTEADLPVTLSLVLPQRVHGTLCTPADHLPGTVQLLVHGGTYNRHYWNLPHDSGRYSYQRDMATRGFATFAVDALGSGASSQPISALISGTGQASVVHQVVARLKSGAVAGTRFERVVLVGHSMGSGIAALAASTYRDVDGVVLTGFSHSVDLVELTSVFVEGVRPAALDPALSRRGADPGYVTTMPGTRSVFHEPGEVEAAVVEADEATKDQVAATVVPDLLPLAFTSPLTRSITVPVLIANGDRDTLFCAYHCENREALLTTESAYFRPEARLDVFLLPRAGHSLALAANAAAYRDAVRAWMTKHFPR